MLHNGMAYEKQRKQDICVLAVSHKQCKTLSIAMVGTWEPNYYPRQACIFQIEHASDRPSKNPRFRISTCLPLSGCLPAGNVGNSKSLNTTRPRVQVSRAAWHCYLNVAILNSVLYIINQGQQATRTNATHIQLWGSNSGDALETNGQCFNHFFPQHYQSARLPEFSYLTES